MVRAILLHALSGRKYSQPLVGEEAADILAAFLPPQGGGRGRKRA